MCLYLLLKKCHCDLQASKLGLGKNRAIVSYFSAHQVIQFNYSTLVLTFVAKSSANTGKGWSDLCNKTTSM